MCTSVISAIVNVCQFLNAQFSFVLHHCSGKTDRSIIEESGPLWSNKINCCKSFPKNRKIVYFSIQSSISTHYVCIMLLNGAFTGPLFHVAYVVLPPCRQRHGKQSRGCWLSWIWGALRNVCGWTLCPVAWPTLIWRSFCRQRSCPRHWCCQRWRTQRKYGGWVKNLVLYQC